MADLSRAAMARGCRARIAAVCRNLVCALRDRRTGRGPRVAAPATDRQATHPAPLAPMQCRTQWPCRGSGSRMAGIARDRADGAPYPAKLAAAELAPLRRLLSQ